MKTGGDLAETLRRELGAVAAPAGLWARVEEALAAPAHGGAARPGWWLLWRGWAPACIAVVLLLAGAGWAEHFRHANAHALDLGAYLQPVMEATGDDSAVAIDHAPAQFRSAPDPRGSLLLGSYVVDQRRVAEVKGEPVRQLILKAAGTAAALFIASPKVRFSAGNQRWIEEDFGGVRCKRLNSARLRTVLFPCSKEICVLVCKTCSTQAVRALMGTVAAETAELH